MFVLGSRLHLVLTVTNTNMIPLVLFRKLQEWIIIEREELKVSVINREMEMHLLR